MSIYGSTVVNEGLIGDVLKNFQAKRELKNKRSQLVDSILPIINKDAISKVKNGIGIENYSLFRTIDDSAFVNSKSNTFTVYYAPVETNKDVNDLSIQIANDLNMRINFRELLKTQFEDGVYTYESWTALIRSVVKNSLFNSKLFTAAINQYWKAVENYANEKSCETLADNISAKISNDDFSSVVINMQADKSNYYLIISVTLY